MKPDDGVIASDRSATGLTQTRLAELAGTTQSAIATYEAATREPTVPVLARMISATDARLDLTVAPDPSLYRLADVAVFLACGHDVHAVHSVWRQVDRG